jgi:hypothetical protein
LAQSFSRLSKADIMKKPDAPEKHLRPVKFYAVEKPLFYSGKIGIK